MPKKRTNPIKQTNPITSGVVAVEDRNREGRIVRVELSFGAEAGIDGQDRLEVVAAITSELVAATLGKE